ncbi:F-box protein SKIP16 [Seminavis robusta]|uniref:F-box protein SKIP16 n=1 Tax=Seminavis robusta TaxID=568900 RepID=A0A9N8EKX2_9STRA|nr:F-box protein SKIP16 [Seminavis robusta]|eukprot:Sro1133_g244840.1 F-box protein SKIP16 (513) ;mRNA; r:23133-24671
MTSPAATTAAATAATTTTPSLQSFVDFCSVEDIFHQFVPFLTYQDVGRLESTSKFLQTRAQESMWKMVCRRDNYYCSSGEEEDEHDDDGMTTGPTYHEERQSFDCLEKASNWKDFYHKWWFWSQWTHGAAKPHHLREAISLWARCKAVLVQQGLHNVVQSLSPCLTREEFGALLEVDDDDDGAGVGHVRQFPLPSSLVAFLSVHGGQQALPPRSQDQEFFAGLFGSYSCYDHFYSMRLVKMGEFLGTAFRAFPGSILIAISVGNPRMFLFLQQPTPDDPEGKLTAVYNSPLASRGQESPVVGHGGILTYLRQYVERLEAGVYKRVQILDESPSSQGIGLFPDGGPTMSRAVTRGIEVRASARWFPAGIQDQQGRGLNFGYSIRIQMVDADPEFDTCQLVSRHWEFMDGEGNVRRVDGEAVVGKQPVFFRDATTGKPGFIDMGPAGDDNRYADKTFVYQSQSGPVAGTSQQDSGGASVKGTFSFVPGTIGNPTGPRFHVVVASFPLTVPTPFY